MSDNNSIKHFLIIIALTVSVLTSCQGQTGKKEILTTKIQYDVPIINGDPQMDWWVNNIEGSIRDPFTQRILKAALDGEVKVFDYYFYPLSPNEIVANSSDTVYQTLRRTNPPYEEFDTMIVRTIDYQDIVKIRFLEEWTWEPNTLEIDKKVIALGPVIQRQIGGEAFNQLLYWIYLDKGRPLK
jgi:hypothetical protein